VDGDNRSFVVLVRQVQKNMGGGEWDIKHKKAPTGGGVERTNGERRFGDRENNVQCGAVCGRGGEWWWMRMSVA
jgi:hypothetical protein